MHYNHIPLWDFEVHTSVKSEEGGYSNRNQWKNNPNYKPRHFMDEDVCSNRFDVEHG